MADEMLLPCKPNIVWTKELKEAQTVPGGPWHEEPDILAYVDEATSYNCAIIRGYAGALNGYVAVPESHVLYHETWQSGDSIPVAPYVFTRLPNHEKLYRGCKYPLTAEFCEVIRGHGGVNFQIVKHNLKWFGFDCSHSGDMKPLIKEQFMLGNNGTYRDLAYVQKEVAELASDLLEYEKTAFVEYHCTHGFTYLLRRGSRYFFDDNVRLIRERDVEWIIAGTENT
jgi:hypothetical protein